MDWGEKFRGRSEKNHKEHDAIGSVFICSLINTFILLNERLLKYSHVPGIKPSVRDIKMKTWFLITRNYIL